MPLYNYVCDAHGEFVDWRSMSDSAAPAPCPACGHAAARAISLPTLALMNHTTRKAHHINERSADQPRIETRVAAKEDTGHGGRGHAHGHAHAHGGRGGHRHGGSSRPWMIGH